MEADLSRFHQRRFSDRWRFDEDGTRRLTLREIWVCIEDLPGTSRIVKHYNGGKNRWGDLEFLTSDVVHALTGKAHPARPKPRTLNGDRRETPQRAAIRAKRIAAKRARERASLDRQRSQRNTTT